MSDTPPQDPNQPLSTEESGQYPEEQEPGVTPDDGGSGRRASQEDTPDEADLGDDDTATGNTSGEGRG